VKGKTIHPLIECRPRFYLGQVQRSQFQGEDLRLAQQPPQTLQGRIEQHRS